MPELPEVEVICRGLAARIEHHRVTCVELRRPDIVRGHRALIDLPLAGAAITTVRRAGKLVRIDFDNDVTLHVHLGMTGRLTVGAPELPLEPHTHLRMRFDDDALELRHCDPRRFGGIWVTGTQQPVDWVGRRLPPIAADPLTISPSAFARLLSRRCRIKSLLMAQQPISGIGNIYCDEALHRAGIHPLKGASELHPDHVRRLYRSLRAVLREAIAAGGSSVSDYRDATNTRGTFQKRHRVYGREGKACRRCRAPIIRMVVATRGTHFCPNCQPL